VNLRVPPEQRRDAGVETLDRVVRQAHTAGPAEVVGLVHQTTEQGGGLDMLEVGRLAHAGTNLSQEST
jgi:hypothetical protein